LFDCQRAHFPRGTVVLPCWLLPPIRQGRQPPHSAQVRFHTIDGNSGAGPTRMFVTPDSLSVLCAGQQIRYTPVWSSRQDALLAVHLRNVLVRSSTIPMAPLSPVGAPAGTNSASSVPIVGRRGRRRVRLPLRFITWRPCGPEADVSPGAVRELDQGLPSGASCSTSQFDRPTTRTFSPPNFVLRG